MFSGFAVYIGNRLVLMLRDHPRSPQDNGIWLVLSEIVSPEDPQLRLEFPSLRGIELLGNKIGHWLLIPSDGPRFEDEAAHACDLLLRHDPARPDPCVAPLTKNRITYVRHGQSLTKPAFQPRSSSSLLTSEVLSPEFTLTEAVGLRTSLVPP